MEEENKNVEENVQPVETPIEEKTTETPAPVEPVVEEPVVESTPEVAPVEEQKPVETVPPVEETTIEEPVKKAKSNKPLLLIVIIIFMAFIFGLGLYLGLKLSENKGNGSNNNETPNNTENTETPEPEPTNTDNTNDDAITMDINDPVVQQLFSIFNYDLSNYVLFGEKLNTDNEVKLKLAYKSLDPSEIKERTCGDLEPYINGLYCGDMTSEMNEYYSKDEEAFKKATLKNTTKYIEENSIKNKFEELFSSNYQYKGESFGFDGSQYRYYEDKSLYALYLCECGGTYGNTSHIINSAYKIGDKLYLETVYDREGNKYNVKYEFILENGNYKFSKVTES